MLKKGSIYCTTCHETFTTEEVWLVGADSSGKTMSPIYFKAVENRPVLQGVSDKDYRVVDSKFLRRTSDGFMQFSIEKKDNRRGDKKITIIATPENRICPHCQHPIHALQGTADGYVIGLIGNTAVGKSSFCNAVLTDAVMKTLGMILGCEITAYTNKNKRKITATNPGYFDMSCCFDGKI